MQKNYQKSFLTILLASSLALPFNAASAKGFFSRWSSQQPSEDINLQQANETAQQVYQTMLGEFLVMAGDYSQAYSLTLAAAQKAKDDRLFERTILIARHHQDYKMALEAAKKWQAALPNSKSAHHYTLDLLIQQQLFDQTPPAIQGMLQASPSDTRPEMIAAMGKYLAPHARQISPYYVQAMQPWLESDIPQEAAAAWVSIAIIELSAKNTEQAYAALFKAHSLDPSSKEATLFAIEAINPSYPQAETLVQNYLNSPDASEQVRFVYVQSLLQRQQAHQAREQLQIITQNPDTLSIAWFLLGSLQMEEKQFAAGKQTLQTFLAKSHDDESAETQTNRDQAYLELAQAEVELGKPGAAQQWIQQISTPQIKEAAQNSYIGILVDAKKYDQALQLINQIPEDSDQQRSQKIALRAQVLIQAERWTQAYNYLENVNTKNHASDPHLLYLQSLAATETGRYKQAETLLRNLIQKDPANASAMNALGYLFAERNTNLEEAKELIQQSLKLEPNNPAALDSLGWVELKRGNMKVALHLLERAYKNFPDPEVAAHYGQALWISDQHDQALAIWKIALTEAPNHKYLRNTLKQLGIPLAKVKNFELPAQGILPLDQSNITADNFTQIIEHLYNQKEWQKLYDILASFSASNNVAFLLDLQAHAASGLGRYEEAEKLYRQAIEAQPQSGSAYNNLGYMLVIQNERLNEAKDLIQKANELEPNNAAFLDSLGWIEFKLGNHQQAITHLRQAYYLKPDIAEIGIHLGEVLWQNGSKAEALLIWKDVQYHHKQNTADNQLLEETLNRLNIRLP